MLHFTKLTFEHFRNFDRRIEIPLHWEHTIVLGSNGAGKSNIPSGIAFVLAADKELLGIEREQDFINQTHRLEAPDTASCTVTLTLRTEINVGVEVVLRRTLNVNAESVYSVDGTIMTDVQYRARLKSLHLQAAAVLVPQRFAGGPVSTGQYGFGKYLESFCDLFNDQKFTEADEQALRAATARASTLKRRMTTCSTAIRRLTSLRPAFDGNAQALRQRITRGERTLMLAELWKVDERRRVHMEKLTELRALNVDQRRTEAREEITVLQNAITEAKQRLDELHQNQAENQRLESELHSKAQFVARLASSKNRLRDLMVKVLGSSGDAQNQRTQLMDNLYREMLQLEKCNIIGSWLRRRMNEFEGRFREEHPEEFQALKDLEDDMAKHFENRTKINKMLGEEKKKCSEARGEKKRLEERVDELKRTKRKLEWRIDIQKSILKQHDFILNDLHAVIDRKQKRLTVLRRHRSSSIQRSTSAEDSDFELRCLLEGIREVFEDKLPGTPVYGLLTDLIKPKDSTYGRSFRSFLNGRLSAITVKDQPTREFVESLLIGDEQYQPPATEVVVLPPSRSSRRLRPPKKGVTRLGRTWAVSDHHKQNKRMAERIMQLIDDLTCDAVFCDSEALAREMSSKEVDGTQGRVYMKAVTADGTLCSGPGTMSVFSSKKVPEVNAQDRYKRPEEILREIRQLESYLQKKAGVTNLMYRALRNKLRFSIAKNTKNLNDTDEELNKAELKLTALSTNIGNYDERCRTIRAEIELFRSGAQILGRRTRRAELLSVKLGYITTDVSLMDFSNEDVRDSLKLSRIEAVMEIDFLLQELRETHEEEMQAQWHARMRESMEANYNVRLEELNTREEAAKSAKEVAEQSLAAYKDELRERIGEEGTLLESLSRFNGLLSAAFEKIEKLSREAATNAIRERRALLRIKKLQQTRRDLYLKLNQGAHLDEQDDDDIVLDEEQILNPGPVVDFSQLPAGARASESAMATYMRGLRKTLSGLRCEMMTRVVRERSVTLPADDVLEARLAEKGQALTELQQSHRDAVNAIELIDSRKKACNEKLNELLRDLYQRLPQKLLELSEDLTGRLIAMEVKKPNEATFINSEVTFGFGAAGPLGLSTDTALTVDHRVALWLSIIATVQEMFQVVPLVLDEIDARMGHERAQIIHRWLQLYGGDPKQVICITHKPEATVDLGLDIRFIGVIRCPVTSSTMVVLFHALTGLEPGDQIFVGHITHDEVEYVLDDPPPLQPGSPSGSDHDPGDDPPGSGHNLNGDSTWNDTPDAQNVLHVANAPGSVPPVVVPDEVNPDDEEEASTQRESESSLDPLDPSYQPSMDSAAE